MAGTKVEFRRVNNRCMISWIVALCFTVTLMFSVNSISRWPPPKDRSSASGGISSWLQAAHANIRSLHALATADNSSQTQQPQLVVTKPPLYPPPFRLSDIPDFHFVINNDVCGSAPVSVVMVVTSDTRRPSWRADIRAALPSQVLAELHVRRVFLLAELAPPANVTLQYDRRVAALQAENHEHADIVVGSFRDAYRNLTYKHLMGLHWATAYCPQAKYILKMDHDIVVDVFQMVRRLSALPAGAADSNVLIGSVFAGTAPIRDQGNKWYVSKKEFPEDSYPPYMSGWSYLVTPDAASRLAAAGNRQPFFWVDDAFVTGVLRHREALNIRMVDFDQLWNYHDDGKSYGVFTMEISCVYECAAAAEASVSQCNMMVGPVWENRLMLQLFYKHAEYCYRHGCTPRRPMPAACANGAGNRYQRQDMPQNQRDIGDATS